MAANAPKRSLDGAISLDGTFSIVAASLKTAQIGAAGGTCKPLPIIDRKCNGGMDPAICIYRAYPGIGAVIVQGNNDDFDYDSTLDLLKDGMSPRGAIEMAAIHDYERFSLRQIGVVSLQGFTGKESRLAAGVTGYVPPEMLDIQSTRGSYTFAAQGNSLTGGEVVRDMAEAFQERPGSRTARRGGKRDYACEFAERLMRALEAAAGGDDFDQGDYRCVDGEEDIPASSVFISIENADGSGFLKLEAEGNTPDTNPIRVLRTRFEEWKARKGCS